MRNVMFIVVLAAVCCVATLTGADTGPSAPYYVKSIRGFGPLERGTIDTLYLKIGSTRTRPTIAIVHVVGDSASPFEITMPFDTSIFVPIDVRQLQRSTSASLSVDFFEPGGTKITTATRALDFVWGNVGVRLDSASSIPFEIGTRSAVTLLFSRPAIALPIDSVLISLVSADTVRSVPVYRNTTIPDVVQISIPTDSSVDLGAMVSVVTVYRDAQSTRARTLLPLPLQPTPIKFKSLSPTLNIRTNNYGAYRSPYAPTVPLVQDTFTLYDLPRRCERVQFSALLVDGTLVPFESVTPQPLQFLPQSIWIPVRSSELDARTVAIQADVYVKDIDLPFSVLKNVTFDLHHPIVSVRRPNGTPTTLSLRRWNPHNSGTATLQPDTAIIVRLQWPVTGIDSSLVYFLSATGQPLATTVVGSGPDRASATFEISYDNTPMGTVGLQVLPMALHMPPGCMTWDTTLQLLPPFPAFQFQRHSERTSSGVGNVNDVLTITDLPSDVTSLRLRMVDPETNITYMDTTASGPSVPYSGNVLFSNGATFSMPSIVGADTTATVAFFVRSFEQSPFTLVRWQHPLGDLVIRMMADGTLRAEMNGDSLISSTVVRTGTWKHVGIVVRDTGIAIFVDAALQGIIHANRWKTQFTANSSVQFGDASNVADSVFALAGVRSLKSVLGFSQLQRLQSLNGLQSGALLSYPMDDAIATSPTTVRVNDERSGAPTFIQPAVPEAATALAFSTFYLHDIGHWRVSLGREVLHSRGINAIVTSTRQGIPFTDTVPQLIQLQTTALAPDSAKCLKMQSVNSQVYSSEGWGPFNSLEPVGSNITYHSGYTWREIAESEQVKKDQDIDCIMMLMDNGGGQISDSVTMHFKPSYIKSQPPDSEFVIVSSHPLRMDRIYTSDTYLTILPGFTVNGIDIECQEIDARVSFTPPPPLNTSFSKIGPFRQSKIPDGDHAWNTFSAYTDDAVESNVVFVVSNDSATILKTVQATHVQPGVWTADIDMAQCDPPLGVVTAWSYDGPSIKRVSDPSYFAITPNRPAWLAQKNNVRWGETTFRDGKATAKASVCAGPLHYIGVPKSVPLFGGAGLLTLPTVFHTRLLWDPATNKLTIDTTESSVESVYATHQGVIEGIDIGATIGNNTTAVAMSTYDIINTVLKKEWANIGSINFNVQNLNEASMRLDRFENLDVHAVMSQTAELYWGIAYDVVKGIVEEALEQAEAAGEGPGAFFVEITFAPTVEGSARFLVQHNIGSDTSGKWKSRGTFPVAMGKINGPSLVGNGLGMGFGLAVSVQFLKGVAAITVYLTEDGDVALAEAYTCSPNTPDSVLSSPKVEVLQSQGISTQFLLQSSEVWGAIQQTLYGPKTFFQVNLFGDDLRDLYPAVGRRGGEAVQEVEHRSKATYPLPAIATMAAPFPHTTRSATHTYTTWIDQDHATGVGTLNVSVRSHGHDTVEAIHRVTSNGNSMISPHVTVLSDTTVLVVWKELAVTRSTITSTTSKMAMYASSDIHWAVVNTERGVVLSTASVASASYHNPALRTLMVEGHPTAIAMSDTSAMIAFVSTDTLGAEAAIFATEVHGRDGMFITDTTKAIVRGTSDQRTPHLSHLSDGRLHCTWIMSDSLTSALHESTYENGQWLPPHRIDLPSFLPSSIDVDDSGSAAVVVGVVRESPRDHERMMVLQRESSGKWDAGSAIVIRGLDAEGMMQHPKISVRGDSAFVLVRSTAHMQMRTGERVFRYPTAVVDLRTGRTGTGRWDASDSLSIINDFDIQWEPTGIHVIAQEHLPFAGLHTNGTLRRPVGAPLMNLGMHTLPINTVITGVSEPYRDTDQHQQPFLSCTPTPARDVVQVASMQPFTSASVYSLHGENLLDGYRGDAVSATTIDVSALPAGTYLLVVESFTAGRVATMLRIGAR